MYGTSPDVRIGRWKPLESPSAVVRLLHRHLVSWAGWSCCTA